MQQILLIMNVQFLVQLSLMERRCDWTLAQIQNSNSLPSVSLFNPRFVTNIIETFFFHPVERKEKERNDRRMRQSAGRSQRPKETARKTDEKKNPPSAEDVESPSTSKEPDSRLMQKEGKNLLLMNKKRQILIFITCLIISSG